MALLEKAITTQEEFDAAIGERLKREAKKFEGYISPADLEKVKNEHGKQIDDLMKQIADQAAAVEAANKKAAGYDKEIADRDEKIRAYETASVKTRIAHETGLPYELAARLNGETEDDIRKDAETIKQFVTPKETAPLFSSTPGSNDQHTHDMSALLAGLRASE